MAKAARAIGQLIALARAPRGNSGHKFPEVAFCLITGLLLAKTARAKSAKIARALAGNPGHKFPEVAFCLITGLVLAKTARAIGQLIALPRARLAEIRGINSRK